MRDCLKGLTDIIGKLKSVTITDFTIIPYNGKNHYASVDITVSDLRDLRILLDTFDYGLCKWDGEFISGSACEIFLRFSYEFSEEFSDEDICREFTYKQCLFKGKI